MDLFCVALNFLFVVPLVRLCPSFVALSQTKQDLLRAHSSWNRHEIFRIDCCWSTCRWAYRFYDSPTQTTVSLFISFVV